MHTPKELEKLDSAVQRRIRMEVRIIRQLVKDALAAGFKLSVDDGEEQTPYYTEAKPVFTALMNTDEDYLHLYKPGLAGWVRLVYGNDGYDVISDYTTNLESVLAGANSLAEKVEVGK